MSWTAEDGARMRHEELLLLLAMHTARSENMCLLLLLQPPLLLLLLLLLLLPPLILLLLLLLLLLIPAATSILPRREELLLLLAMHKSKFASRLKDRATPHHDRDRDHDDNYDHDHDRDSEALHPTERGHMATGAPRIISQRQRPKRTNPVVWASCNCTVLPCGGHHLNNGCQTACLKFTLSLGPFETSQQDQESKSSLSLVLLVVL